MGRLLVTAFGPFGAFKDNPSEVLAREVVGDKVVVLPVSYAAVDEFVSCPPGGYDRALMLGVRQACDRLRVERVARNVVGKTKDIDGAVYGPDLIDADAPDWVEGTLFAGWNHATRAWKPTRNAGSFLCNYLYFRIATKWPRVRSGFVHVPPFSALSLSEQSQFLARILARIEKESA